MDKKGEFRISELFIGLCIVAVITTIIGSFISYASNTYGGGGLTDSQQSVINDYNKLNDINEKNKLFQNNTKAKTSLDLTDQLGAFFGQGYNTMRLLAESGDIVTNVTDTASNQTLFLGSDGEGKGTLGVIKTAIISILFILIFIGLIVGILVKGRV